MICTETKTSSGLRRGARVRMSPLGRQRHPKYGDREGLIVGGGSSSSWRVKFDGRTTIQAIYKDYLELAPTPAAARSEAASPRIVRRKAAPAL